MMGAAQRISAALVCATAIASFGAGVATAQIAVDADCDGVVTSDERERLVEQIYAGSTCARADGNRDGLVNAADLLALIHGPRITFAGLTSPDGRPGRPIGDLPGGETVYFQNGGLGFNLVVEAAPGPSGAAVGVNLMDHVPGQPARRGDLQVIVGRDLGDGTRVVCDQTRGVPAVDPESFAYEQPISDAINDLACRFAVATTPSSTCTQNEFGQTGFLVAGSRAQYCLHVDGFVGFPSGDTRISVQVRDSQGTLSPIRRLVVQVGSGPPPPTFTATPSPTYTPIATVTPTRPPTSTHTVTRTPTSPPTSTPTRVDTPTAPAPSRTATPTRTRTNTTGPSFTPTQTHTRTPTGTRSPSSTPTITRTRTPSSTPTRTRTSAPGTSTHTPTRTRTPTNTPTRTRTPAPGTATNTPTNTRTFTPTRSFTRTHTSTVAPATPTDTRTRTPSVTPSPTSNLPTGPVITFFGLATASDIVVPPAGEVGGVPLFTRPFGSGFSIIVEAAPGISGRPVLLSTYSLFAAPDLQIQVTNPLGDGSGEVCDNTPPVLGGVPAINPPTFSSDQEIVDVVNDLSCRFVDGQNRTVGRPCFGDPCTLRSNGQFGCAATASTVQFCGLISQNLTFRNGDTTVSVRARDSAGNFGPVSSIVVRIE